MKKYLLIMFLSVSVALPVQANEYMADVNNLHKAWIKKRKNDAVKSPKVTHADVKLFSEYVLRSLQTYSKIDIQERFSNAFKLLDDSVENRLKSSVRQLLSETREKNKVANFIVDQDSIKVSNAKGRKDAFDVEILGVQEYSVKGQKSSYAMQYKMRIRQTGPMTVRSFGLVVESYEGKVKKKIHLSALQASSTLSPVQVNPFSIEGLMKSWNDRRGWDLENNPMAVNVDAGVFAEYIIQNLYTYSKTTVSDRSINAFKFIDDKVASRMKIFRDSLIKDVIRENRTSELTVDRASVRILDDQAEKGLFHVEMKATGVFSVRNKKSTDLLRIKVKVRHVSPMKENDFGLVVEGIGVSKIR